MTTAELKAWAEAHAPLGCSVSKAVLNVLETLELATKVRDAQR